MYRIGTNIFTRLTGSPCLSQTGVSIPRSIRRIQEVRLRQGMPQDDVEQLQKHQEHPHLLRQKQAWLLLEQQAR